MNPKISVVIPIYGVEKYLDRCVESIVNQTYKNLEIILVDDGSPDNCPKMCDEWASRDARIRTVHRENGGQSCARNTGLSMATGNYITFVDSDDWIAPTTYEYALHVLAETAADVLQFDYSLATDDKVFKKNPNVECHEVFEGKEILQHYLTTTTGSYSVWRCLFSTELTVGIRFREGKINEDIDWKYKVLQRSKRWVDCNQVKYFYYQSGNSTSGAPLKKRDFQLREAADILCELTSRESYGTIAFLGKVKKARTALSLLCKIAYYGVADETIDKRQTIKELTAEHRKNIGTLLKAPIPMSRKVLSVMFAMNYKITEIVIRMAKTI